MRCLRMSLILRSGSVLIAVTREEPGILKDLFRRTPMLPPVGEASTLSLQTWICDKAGRSRCNWDDITRSSVLSFFKSGLFRSIHRCQFLVHRLLPTLAQFHFIKGWRLEGTIVLDDSQFTGFNLPVNFLCLKGRPKWKIRPEFLCSTSLLYKFLPIHLVACKPAVYTFYTSRLR